MARGILSFGGMTYSSQVLSSEKDRMSPTTKEAQRAELHKTIWRIPVRQDGVRHQHC